MLCGREQRRLPTAAQVNNLPHGGGNQGVVGTGKIRFQMHGRFAVAMGIYAVLAVLGAVLLTGKIRDALWILLAGLALKTWIAMAQRN